MTWIQQWMRIGAALDGPLNDAEITDVLDALQQVLMSRYPRVDIRIEQCVAAPDDPT